MLITNNRLCIPSGCKSKFLLSEYKDLPPDIIKRLPGGIFFVTSNELVSDIIKEGDSLLHTDLMLHLRQQVRWSHCGSIRDVNTIFDDTIDDIGNGSYFRPSSLYFNFDINNSNKWIIWIPDEPFTDDQLNKISINRCHLLGQHYNIPQLFGDGINRFFRLIYWKSKIKNIFAKENSGVCSSTVCQIYDNIIQIRAENTDTKTISPNEIFLFLALTY